VNADVPLVVGFTPGRTIMSSADPGEHELAIAFTEIDPCVVWADLELPAASFASPFLATIPGTDTYTDEV
jgi:hypothetical protein